MSFNFSDLQKDAEMQKAFISSLQQIGYGVISFGSTPDIIHTMLQQDLGQFFKKITIEDKLDTKYDSKKEVGYFNNPELGKVSRHSNDTLIQKNFLKTCFPRPLFQYLFLSHHLNLSFTPFFPNIFEKEFYAFRKPQSSEHMPWTDQLQKNIPAMHTNIGRLWDFFEETAKTILGMIARFFEVDAARFLELTEPHIPQKVYATSMLHLFRYYGFPFIEENPNCIPHTDSGLITLIPITFGAGGLQVLNWKERHFDDIEQMFDSGSHIVVLAGETLSYLTCNTIRATVHQVVFKKEERLSIPFQLRASPEAVLDCASLGLKGVVVSDLFRKVYKVKEWIQ